MLVSNAEYLFIGGSCGGGHWCIIFLRLSSIINVLKCTNLRLRYFLFSFVNVSYNYGCKNEVIDLVLKRQYILIWFHPRYIFRFFISSCMLSDSFFSQGVVHFVLLDIWPLKQGTSIKTLARTVECIQIHV